MYVKDPCGYDPPLSSFLGSWDSELEPDEYIDSWVVSVRFFISKPTQGFKIKKSFDFKPMLLHVLNFIFQISRTSKLSFV